MIEIKVICDGCGEVINTRKTLQDLREFIDDSDHYINNALTGEHIVSPFFTPSMIIDGKHLHYCNKCKKEIIIPIRLGDTE